MTEGLSSRGPNGAYSEQSRPLEGIRVCMLRESDYAFDNRARKQASALTEAGAGVTMIGVGAAVPPDLADAGYDIRLVSIAPRLGREDVWWPIRVTVNLTYTRFLEWRLRRRTADVFMHEPALVAAAKRLNPDVVHAYNVRTLPAAMRVKRATGARVVYDCRDLYGDVEYYDEATRARFKAAEAKCIGGADAVVTVSPVFADILQSRYGIARPEVIHNGPGEVVDAPEPVHEPVRLFFQGAYRRNRNLIALLDAMSALRGRATLTLQGFGEMESELRDQVIALGLEGSVSLVGPVKPADVVKSASEHDVGVICYKGDTLNLRSTVPNKLLDYLGAGLGLAVSDLPGHRTVLDGTGAGILMDPTSAKTIARALACLIDEPEQIADMKRAAIETARCFEWSVQADRLIRVYMSALDRGSEART